MYILVVVAAAVLGRGWFAAVFLVEISESIFCTEGRDGGMAGSLQVVLLSLCALSRVAQARCELLAGCGSFPPARTEKQGGRYSIPLEYRGRIGLPAYQT